MKIRMSCLHFTLASVFLLIFTGLGLAQRPRCSVGTTRFDCPDYFMELKGDDNSLRIFKYKEAGNNLYFFAFDSSTSFDVAKVGEAIKSYYPKTAVQELTWKTVKDPLTMDTKTKYKYDLIASMALGATTLFEVKGFVFQLADKKVVLGYISDWTEDVNTNRRRFQNGKGFADNAAGCNAVVSVLNSITKEFKDPKQYCFLSAIGASK